MTLFEVTNWYMCRLHVRLLEVAACQLTLKVDRQLADIQKQMQEQAEKERRHSEQFEKVQNAVIKAMKGIDHG